MRQLQHSAPRSVYKSHEGKLELYLWRAQHAGVDMQERDRQIAARIRQDSEAAFEELFRAYCDSLCVFAENYVRSVEVAEDLVHDVFCDVWDRRHQFDPEGTVKRYLFSAVRNKALNWLKHQRVRRDWQQGEKRDGTSSTADPSQRAEYGELEEALGEAVRDLSERQRQVYQMARQNGLSYAEIAGILEISNKTVENHMGRALKQLREALTSFLSLLL